MVDVSAFHKDNPKPYLDRYESDSNPRASAMDEMRSYGFQVPPVAVIGDVQRVATADDTHKKQSGWYIYQEFPDFYNQGAFVGVCVFGSWKGHPEKVTWSSKRKQVMTESELNAFQKLTEEAKIKRLEQKRQDQEVARIKAQAIWDAAVPVTDHPYLTNKGVKPNGLRQSTDPKYTSLIATCRDEYDALMSLQFIDTDGKKFLAGGRVDGCAIKFDGAEDIVAVAEGWATAATVHEATGWSVYAALNANNLRCVTNWVKRKHPNAVQVTVGDDDAWTDGNPGRTKAEAVRETIKIFPEFEGLNGKPTDFNDLHCREGLEAVRRQLLDAVSSDTLRDKHLDAQTVNGFPDRCLMNDGLFGDICAYIDQTALRPQPILTILAVLAMFAAIFGRRYQVERWNTQTNLLTVGLLSTGRGKDHPRKKIKSLMVATGLGHILAGGEFTSGSAIRSALFRNPVLLSFPDEFGKYLKSINSKNASAHQVQIGKVIMEIYSDSGSTHHGVEYSSGSLKKGDETQRKDIINPSLNIYATSTPSTFYGALKDEDISSGFLNRILVAEGNETVRLDPASIFEVDDQPPPEGLILRLRDAYAAVHGPDTPNQDLAETEPEMRMVALDAEAKPATIAVMGEQERRINDPSERHNELWCRFFENTVKVAAIKAIVNNPQHPKITIEHIEWASDFVRWCVSNLSHRLAENISENERERRAKEILEYIRSGGTDGRAKRDITRKFQKVDQRERREILDDLEQSGVIEMTKITRPGAKKPADVFVMIGKL